MSALAVFLCGCGNDNVASPPSSGVGLDANETPIVQPFGGDSGNLADRPLSDASFSEPKGGQGEPSIAQDAAELIDNIYSVDSGLTWDATYIDGASGDSEKPNEVVREEDGGTDAEQLTAGDATTDDAARPGNITVWVAGDSTVANGLSPCPTGWGAFFASNFQEDVTIVNSAVGGRSVRTWLYEVGTTMDSSGECVLAKDESGEPKLQPRWQAMLDGMQAGDYLLIQFGINDSSPTCDRHVGLDAFQASYGMMAQAAEERGAHPIFLTPVSAIACNGWSAIATRGGFVDATIQAGETYSVPVIDLHERSIALYQQLNFCPIPGGDVSASTGGPVGDFFCDDHTHFSQQGSLQIGLLIGEALRERKLGLSAYLK